MRSNRVGRMVRAAVVLLTVTGALVIAAPAAWACACGPYAPPLTSTGVGTETQSVTITPPPGGTVEMINEYGTPVTTWNDYSGFGVYDFDSTTNTISFTPVPGFLGTPNPFHLVGYRLTDINAFTDENTYTPTVTAPPPYPLDTYTSTGPVDTLQSVTVPVPPDSEMSGLDLLDGNGDPASTVSLPAVGAYAINRSTGVITFTPVSGYTGSPTPVGFRYTDAYGQPSDSTYAPTVTAPPPTTTTTTTAPTTTTTPTTTAPPSAPDLTSTGATGTSQTVTVPVPPGGTIRLLDAAGLPVTTVAVAGEGTWTLDAATGAITFTPVAGFVGDAAPLRYLVTDADGVPATGTVTVHVLGIEVSAPTRSANGTLPVTGGGPGALGLGGLVLLTAGTALAVAVRRRSAR